MTNSFISAAKIMDPVLPPTSLRQFCKLHRWVNPPVVISLREILARHQEPLGSVRFLAYNTFLLDGFSIKDISLEMVYELVDHLKVDILSIVIESSLHPSKLLKLANKPVEELLGFLFGDGWKQAVAGILNVLGAIEGIIDDCLNCVTFGIWGEVTDWGKVSIGMILDVAGKTVDEMLDILHVSPEDIFNFLCAVGIDPLRILSILFYYFGGRPLVELILKIAGKDIDLDHIGQKPEVLERATELGRVLAEPMEVGPGEGIFLPYGIISLCEAFSEDTQNNIRAAMKDLNCRFFSGPSPSASGKISGGLFQIVRSLSVKNNVMMTFVNRGDPWKDADYWSNKGILLSYIDVGVGLIELYSTHLYNGGEFILDPSTEDRLNRKRAQVGELIDFFHANHDPHNVAIITGDFNLWAHVPEHREIMNWLMQNTGTLDIWDWQWQARNVPENAGHTAEADIPDLCKINGTDSFCEDPTDLQAGARIDWILVEPPRPEHTFMLDLSRVRRRPFPRTGGGFLSDHVGLDTTLIASLLGSA